MTQKKSTHSVDYIRAIKEYLRLRTIIDDLTHEQQVHLSYLAFLVKADGTVNVGYRELQRLRLAPKTIANNNRRFRELGLISKVDVGHGNQFNKGGKSSKFYFDLKAISLMNTESADFPQREDSKVKVLTSLKGSADFPKESADFPKGPEPLPLGGIIPEVLLPEQSLPEELCPKGIDEKAGVVDSVKVGEVVVDPALESDESQSPTGLPDASPSPHENDVIGNLAAENEKRRLQAIRWEEESWKTFDSFAEVWKFLEGDAQYNDDRRRWQEYESEFVYLSLPDGRFKARFIPMQAIYRGGSPLYVPSFQREKKVRVDGGYLCFYGDCKNLAEHLRLYCKEHEYGHAQNAENAEAVTCA